MDIEVNETNYKEVVATYESVLQDVCQQACNARIQCDELKSQLSEIMEENRRLMSTSSPGDSKLINDLKQQIKTLILEKEQLSQLWRDAMRSNEASEEHHRNHMNHWCIPRKDHVTMIKDYEEQTERLKQELSSAVENASKSQQAAETNNSILNNTKLELSSLQAKFNAVMKEKAQLEEKLKEGQTYVAQITATNKDYKSQVLEAIKIIDEAIKEKEQSFLKVRLTNEELERVKMECGRTQIECQKEIDSLKHQLQMAKEETNLIVIEKDKLISQCSLLETQLEKIRKDNMNMDETYNNRILSVEKKLESTFQKLLVSEKQSIQVFAEKESLRNDMEQMAEHYERTIKASEVERNSLRGQLQLMQNKLREANALEIKLQEELTNLKKKYSENVDEKARLITQQFTAEIERIDQQYKDKEHFLQHRLDSKDELYKKQVEESNAMLDNFQTIIVELRTEVQALKKENKKFKEECEGAVARAEQYKKFLDILSVDVEKITIEGVSQISTEHFDGAI